MPTIAIHAIHGAHTSSAFGNIGMAKRMKPYEPIFSSTAARMTDPAVGASTWASGSQVCTGHIGTLIANANANARKYQSWVEGAIGMA